MVPLPERRRLRRQPRHHPRRPCLRHHLRPLPPSRGPPPPSPEPGPDGCRPAQARAAAGASYPGAGVLVGAAPGRDGGGLRHLPVGVRRRRARPGAAQVPARVPRPVHRRLARRPLLLPHLPDLLPIAVAGGAAGGGSGGEVVKVKVLLR